MRFWRRLSRSLPGAANGLYVLAYHRIGDRTATPYDPWVYTADQEQLERQIRYFQQRHRVVGLQEALEIASGRRRAGGRAILITFDDGYLDNYQAGLPVLKSLGVEAVFFLATSFMQGNTLAWWDRIAWLVKTADKRCFRLPMGGSVGDLDLTGVSDADAVMKVLDLYKACPAKDVPLMMEALESAPRPQAEPPIGQLFMGPDQARGLREAGMHIGSHTHGHQILARIDSYAQREELRLSRSILEQETGSTIDILAYPVGGPSDFTRTTQAIAKHSGYRAAFSCHGGINRSGRTDLYDIKRIPVYWGARPEWLLGA